MVLILICINGQDTDLWIRFALKFPVSFNPNRTAYYNKYIDHSLSRNENNLVRYQFLNKFEVEEKTNSSLKIYLDINRFSVAIRSKINGETEIYQKLIKEIDFRNLNIKQKLLLKFPIILVQLFKKIQKFLIKNNFYISAYS